MSTPEVEVLFVAGWGRSGSTLLDRLLGSLAGVTSLGEMRDVCLRGALENRTCGCGTPFRRCAFWSEVGRRAFGELGWDAPEVVRMNRARRLVDRPWTLPLLVFPGLAPPRFRHLLDWYAGRLAEVFLAAASVSGTRRLVDSSKISTHALVLRRAGLGVRPVHLVRDSRAVLSSWRTVVPRQDSGERSDALARYRLLAGALRYLGYNAMAHLLCLLSGGSERVRYEDLAARPGPVVRELAGRLSVPLAPADAGVLRMLDAGCLEHPPPHTVDGNPMRLRQGPLRVRPDERWRVDLPAAQRGLVTALTAPLLLAYRYPLRSRVQLSGPR